jgi:hypothetical protein
MKNLKMGLWELLHADAGGEFDAALRGGEDRSDSGDTGGVTLKNFIGREWTRMNANEEFKDGRWRIVGTASC